MDALLFGRFSLGYTVIGVCAVSAALIAESLTSAPKDSLRRTGHAQPLCRARDHLVIRAGACSCRAGERGNSCMPDLVHCLILWGGASFCMVNRIKTLPLMLST